MSRIVKLLEVNNITCLYFLHGKLCLFLQVDKNHKEIIKTIIKYYDNV